MERKKAIDILKGIGIVFVVLGHYNTFMEDRSWADWIWSFHMPLFFLCGGYLSYGKKAEKFSFCACRLAKRLLLPYLFYFLLSALLQYGILPMVRHGQAVISGKDAALLLRAFLLGGGYLEQTRLHNFPLWFFALYYIAMLAWHWLTRLHGRSRRLFLAAALVLLALVLPLQEALPGRPAFHINALPAGLLFMYAGYYAAALEERYSGARHWLKGEAQYEAGIALCLLFGLGTAYYFPGNIAHIGSLAYLAGALATVLALYLLALKSSSAALQYLGRHSGVILGLHSPAGAAVRNYLEGRLFPEWGGVIMNFLYAFCVILSCAAAGAGIDLLAGRLKIGLGRLLWRNRRGRGRERGI